MEQRIPRNRHSPPSQPPENFLNHLSELSFSSGDTPPIAKRRSEDQAIESAFSKLTLSTDFQPHAHAPPFLGLPETLDDVVSVESVPSSMAFGENQQVLFWAQTHSRNGVVNRPFCYVGARQSINAGPEAMDRFGRSPYVYAGDHPLKLMKYHKRQGFWDYTCDNHDMFSLHGKKQFAREHKNHVPIVPSSLQSNFSLDYNNINNFSSIRHLHLYHLQQQLTPDNMRGRIVSLAKDQLWSDILKLKLEGSSSVNELEMVLSEVMEGLSDLMRNHFGCQFVQKLFVVCNEAQRTRIIMALTKFPFKLISICLSLCGANATQKLLEKLITPQQISLVMSALSPGAVVLANDSHGQQVIQYCIKNFSGEYNKHLFNEIVEKCFKIATNKTGCCVLQSCMEHFHGEARERLLSVIISNAVQLAENPYGNYVVQHLIRMRMEDVTAELLRQCRGYFASLSCNKYASNVVEKLLLESGEKHSSAIIMELVSSPNASLLLVDPFGNFVIQSALSESKGHAYDALLNFIRVNAPIMQRNVYGRKILAWFEKRKLHIA